MSPPSFFCHLRLIVFGGVEFMHAFLTMHAFTFAVHLLETVVIFVDSHSSDGLVPGASSPAVIWAFAVSAGVTPDADSSAAVVVFFPQHDGQVVLSSASITPQMAWRYPLQ